MTQTNDSRVPVTLSLALARAVYHLTHPLCAPLRHDPFWGANKDWRAVDRMAEIGHQIAAHPPCTGNEDPSHRQAPWCDLRSQLQRAGLLAANLREDEARVWCHVAEMVHMGASYALVDGVLCECGADRK